MYSIKCLLAKVCFFVHSSSCSCSSSSLLLSSYDILYHHLCSIVFDFISFLYLFVKWVSFFLFLTLLLALSLSPCPFSPRFTFILLVFFTIKTTLRSFPLFILTLFFAIYFTFSRCLHLHTLFHIILERTHQSNDSIND